MEKATKEVGPEINPAKEIKAATKEIMVEAKEEVKGAPSRLRQELHELEAIWERASVQYFQAPRIRYQAIV
jgi:uncharacterized protein YukE